MASSRKRKACRFRVGKVSYFCHHGAWYIYYCDGRNQVRRRVGSDQSAAATIAAQINAQLAADVPTQFSFTPISVAEQVQQTSNPPSTSCWHRPHRQGPGFAIFNPVQNGLRTRQVPADDAQSDRVRRWAPRESRFKAGLQEEHTRTCVRVRVVRGHLNHRPDDLPNGSLLLGPKDDWRELDARRTTLAS